MNNYDYSIYYRNWHDGSAEQHQQMASYKANQIKNHLKLPLDAQILDVGCGFGFALGGLRMLGYQNLTGVEQSPQQAAVARRAGFNVEITDDTIEWLNTKRESFDGVILFDVLEHVPASIQIDFLRAIAVALKPEGKLMLTVPNANSILASRWLYNDYTHYTSFTEYSLAFVLQNAGFKDIWLDNAKGIGKFPRWALRSRRHWPIVRKWLVRWCWLQVFMAEQPQEPIDKICFELNLTALATKG